MEYPDYDDDAEDYFKDLDNVLSNLKKLRSVHESSKPAAQGLAPFPNAATERGSTDSSGSDGADDNPTSGSDAESEELTELEDEDDDGQEQLPRAVMVPLGGGSPRPATAHRPVGGPHAGPSGLFVAGVHHPQGARSAGAGRNAAAGGELRGTGAGTGAGPIARPLPAAATAAGNVAAVTAAAAAARTTTVSGVALPAPAAGGPGAAAGPAAVGSRGRGTQGAGARARSTGVSGEDSSLDLDGYVLLAQDMVRAAAQEAQHTQQQQQQQEEASAQGAGGAGSGQRPTGAAVSGDGGEGASACERLQRLLAALDTNRMLQAQLGSMLHKLDDHANTSCVLEGRVREQPLVTRPYSVTGRALALKKSTAASAATAAQEDSEDGDDEPTAAAGAPTANPHPTSRYWRVGVLLPPPTNEFKQLAAAQQLPPRPYDRVKWPQRMVDALNKGLTLEVQSTLTKRLMDRLQQEGRGGGGAGGGGGGQQQQQGGRRAPGQQGGGAGTDAGASLQEQLKRISEVRPDSPEAVPLIMQLDAAAWARVAAAHGVGRSGAECAMYYRHNLRPGLAWSLEESTRLMELAEKHGKRNWEQVSRELGTGRTPAQCLAHSLRWKRFDRRPQRSTWSEQDDQLLQALVAQFGTNWVAVSEAFDGRYDRHQVRDRWHGIHKAGAQRRTGKWEPEEDEKLQEAVARLGPKWTAVSGHVPGRTARQCRERYVNLLQPDLKFQEFSKEEEEILAAACKELQAAYGRILWAKVAERLPGRTDSHCARAYDNLVKHKRAHARAIRPPKIPRAGTPGPAAGAGGGGAEASGVEAAGSPGGAAAAQGAEAKAADGGRDGGGRQQEGGGTGASGRQARQAKRRRG